MDGKVHQIFLRLNWMGRRTGRCNVQETLRVNLMTETVLYSVLATSCVNPNIYRSIPHADRFDWSNHVLDPDVSTVSIEAERERESD